MQASPQKQARRGIFINKEHITSKKMKLYMANGRLVTATSQYPKSITLPVLCLLIGGILIKTNNSIMGSIIAMIGVCIWLFSGKKIEDDPKKIQGPTSASYPSHQNRSKSIPKGATPENGVSGWYWKWRYNEKTDPLWSPFFIFHKIILWVLFNRIGYLKLIFEKFSQHFLDGQNSIPEYSHIIFHWVYCIDQYSLFTLLLPPYQYYVPML